MTEIDYEARVKRGIALLDERMPNWAGRINLDRLDIRSGSHCVTAQLSGANNYLTGLKLLGLEEGVHNEGSYTQHGFQTENWDAPGMAEDYDESAAFNTLNDIWHREISARQREDVDG